MAHPDTIKLLQECDAGTKMGVSSIDDVLEKVKDEKLKQLLSESKAHHEKLEEDIEHLLEQMDAEEKEPNPMAKGMSWIKTNVKMGMDDSEGCPCFFIFYQVFLSSIFDRRTSIYLWIKMNAYI